MKLFTLLDKFSRWVILVTVWMMVFVTLVLVLWILLGALLNPERFMPLAVMFVSAFGLIRTLWSKFLELKSEMVKLIQKLIDVFFGLTLDRLLNEVGDLDDEGHTQVSTSYAKLRDRFQICVRDQLLKRSEETHNNGESQLTEGSTAAQGALAMDPSEGHSDAHPNNSLGGASAAGSAGGGQGGGSGDGVVGAGGGGGSGSGAAAATGAPEAAKAAAPSKAQVRTDEQNAQKVDKVYEMLCESAPIEREGVTETLQEPRQLALKIFEKREEHVSNIERRFITGNQMVDLYEEKFEAMDKAFLKVLESQFDEDDLKDKVERFCDLMLPQLIYLKVQSMVSNKSQVISAVYDYWPTEKTQGGMHVDVGIKLDDVMSASTKSDKSSTKSESQFSNAEMRDFTLYEFFCFERIRIFPQLSDNLGKKTRRRSSGR